MESCTTNWTAFPSSTVLIHKSSEHEGISTLPGLIKSSIELETDLFAFLKIEELFQGKNYTALVHLLRATTMQKKIEFVFSRFATHLRFCSSPCTDLLLNYINL